MEHILDNPAWNALISGNRQLSFGSDNVKYFDREVSPFVGFKENQADNFRELYELTTHDHPLLFVTPVEMDIPAPWHVAHFINGIQMVCDTPQVQEEARTGIALVPLTVEHVPQMLDLTNLTNPGPFAAKTIEFGHYNGIFEGGKLVAMAGQRLHVDNYAEVSAVCTHPDHTGRGYARLLLLQQLNRIRAASEIPFLHVRYDNERAIKVYESLGFQTRTPAYFYVLKKRDNIK
jgi:ribosomal protein S18 acetylase RimI-like enzyme